MNYTQVSYELPGKRNAVIDNKLPLPTFPGCRHCKSKRPALAGPLGNHITCLRSRSESKNPSQNLTRAHALFSPGGSFLA